MAQELTTQETNAQQLLNIVATYDEAEQKKAKRTLILLMNTKTIQVKIDDGSQWGKKVNRPLSIYEAGIMYEVCKEYNLNPLMNFVIFLEGNQIYVTLAGHLQNAHQTGCFVGMDIEKIELKDARSFGYKVTVSKLMGDKIVPFSSEGYANVKNVRGGDKKDDIALMQMAEARATRRALSRAFPIGLPYAEDFYEDPNFEKQEQAVLPTGIASKLSEGKVYEPAEATNVTPEAPAKRTRTKKAVETIEPISDEIKEQVAKDSAPIEDEETIVETENQPEDVAEYVEPEPAVGIDQLNRITELMYQLGVNTDAVMKQVATIKTRKAASEQIRYLLDQVEEQEKIAALAEEENIIMDEPEEEKPTRAQLEAEIAGMREKLGADTIEHNKLVEDGSDDDRMMELRNSIMDQRTALKEFRQSNNLT